MLHSLETMSLYHLTNDLSFPHQNVLLNHLNTSENITKWDHIFFSSFGMKHVVYTYVHVTKCKIYTEIVKHQNFKIEIQEFFKWAQLH